MKPVSKSPLTPKPPLVEPRMLTPSERAALNQDLKDSLARFKKMMVVDEPDEEGTAIPVPAGKKPT